MSTIDKFVVSSDILIMNNENQVCLIRRKNEPYKGELALPGGCLELNETIEECAEREAKEETNLNINVVDIIGVYSKPGRDPRGPTVSIAFINDWICLSRKNCKEAKAMDDAAELIWYDLDDIRNIKLAFDHNKIINDAIEQNLCY